MGPGTLVWAKVRGYPWWPGRVKALSEIPKELATIARQSLKRDAIVHPVHFFGSHDYALVPEDGLKPLDEDWEQLSSKTYGSKFRQALVEARILLGKTEPPVESPSGESFEGEEKDLPTNAFIEIDPETGLRTLKKRRGRPPKHRPEDLPAIQYKKQKISPEKNHENSSEKKSRSVKLIKMSEVIRLRRKLQKALLRPELREDELQIAQEIIRRIFGEKPRYKISVDQLDKSKMGYILVKAMKRTDWDDHLVMMMPSFKLILERWTLLP